MIDDQPAASEPLSSGEPTRPDAADVVSFWRKAGPEKWFKKDDAFDAEIQNRFAGLHRDVAAGKCDDWATSAEGSLALVIVLDQFCRNMFRASDQAFATDQKALGFARSAIAAGQDSELDEEMRAFLFMPFMHSEELGVQDESMALFHRLKRRENLDYARIHRDVIVRFGRFPHRNKALGRYTSPAEAAFLDAGGFSA